MERIREVGSSGEREHSTMSSICRHVLVSGRVQGVGFRWYARERAEQLGLAGWVRNLPDGRVELLLEGREGAVEAMLVWLERGPPAAHVRSVEVVERTPGGLKAFDVLH
jgi:acylphosphatase